MSFFYRFKRNGMTHGWFYTEMGSRESIQAFADKYKMKVEFYEGKQP